MSFLARLALGAVLALSLFSPAMAGQPRGSAAWTDDTSWVNTNASLYNGPGPKYGAIGTVGGGLRIRVARCSGLWCEIDAPRLHGWMALGNISFGTYPAGDPRIKSPIQYGGPVCFYTGTNYTGEQYCYAGGHVVQDLLLAGLDNRFASVKVNGGSVMACRDRNFRSYCMILNKDEGHLDSLLSRSISSIEVY